MQTVAKKDVQVTRRVKLACKYTTDKNAFLDNTKCNSNTSIAYNQFSVDLAGIACLDCFRVDKRYERNANLRRSLFLAMFFGLA